MTSYHDKQFELFSMYPGVDLSLGDSEDQVRISYLSYSSCFKHLYTPKADSFQIPPIYNNLPLDCEGFIDYHQSLNVAVGYWVINEMDEMDSLIQKGAHSIVTDFPDISHHLLNERY